MGYPVEYKVNSGQISKIHVLLAKMPGLKGKDDIKAYKKQLVQDYTDHRETSTTKLTWKEANDMIAGLERISTPDPVVREPHHDSPSEPTDGEGLVVTTKGLSVAAHKKLNSGEDIKRKKIIHYCHLMGWYEGVNNMHGSLTDWLAGNVVVPKGAKKVDMERVNGWCVTYGKFKKPLNDHASEELSILIVQMEKVYRDYLNAV